MTKQEKIFAFLDSDANKVGISSWQSRAIKFPFDISANDFLKFAENDLNLKNKKSLVNSLGNTKRSIDCRVDSLLFVFGLHDIAKKENWHFPLKIDVLSQLDIIAPRILKKINTKRNKLEHEYKYPTIDDVEDSLDVATLFIHYTERFVEETYDNCELTMGGDEFTPWLEVKFNYKLGKVSIALYNTDPVEIKCKIDRSDRESYLRFLKHWVNAIKRK